MKKVDVLRKISDLSGVTQKEAELVLDTYAEVILETLKEDKEERIPMLGIGTFVAKHCAEKSGIATLGEKKPWVVPEHDEVALKITKSIRTL